MPLPLSESKHTQKENLTNEQKTEKPTNEQEKTSAPKKEQPPNEPETKKPTDEDQDEIADIIISTKEVELFQMYEVAGDETAHRVNRILQELGDLSPEEVQATLDFEARIGTL